MRGGGRRAPALRLTAAFWVAALAACDNSAAPADPGDTGGGPDPVPAPVDLSRAWAGSTPEAQGFDGDLLATVFADADEAVPNMRALLAVRNGRLVEEAYFGGMHRDSAFDMRSVTKTVTALLVGLASDRGLLDPEDLMTDRRTTGGLNPGRESPNYLQGCTICVPCRWTGHYWTVPRKRENRT